jgi:hypothetical protein
MLRDDTFDGVATEDIISYAQQRLKTCPSDRAIAIAVLRGSF